MKKITFLALFMPILIQSQNFYYHFKERKEIIINKDKFIVFHSKDFNFNEVGYEIESTDSSNSLFTIYRKPNYDKFKILDDFKKNKSVVSIEPVIGEKHEIPSSYIFYIKALNYIKLEEKSKELGFNIMRKDNFMSDWYHCSTTTSSIGNSIEITNNLMRDGVADLVDPGFMFNFKSNCISDPDFGDQWSLNNTGQNGGTSGIDVKACNAWNTTRGNINVIVAVIDEGIELSHTEFTSNISSISFNTMSGTSPSQVFGNHGTHCAGIIGCNQNNNLISGISPEASLMSISNALTVNPNISSQLADGFNFAVNNQASIISNSWGDQGGAAFSNLKSTILETSILNALNNGRNGRGCVVVFAAGNQAPNMDYPGTFFDDIILVGSIDRNGNRASTSAFGNQLDIVAPGVSILSAGLNNTTRLESGTSMACPMASGIAALILSVNPCLSQKAVHDIICKSGQKVGGVTYNSTSRDPQLGDWHQEMGHGLVNAEACVLMANDPNFYLQKTNESNTKNYTYKKILAGKNVTSSIASGDYNITSSGNVNLKAVEDITLKDGFHAQNGCNFHAVIDPSNCNFSSPVLKVSKIETKPNNTPSVSMNQENVKPIITAFPNPTSDVVFIEYTLFDNSNIVIEVFDIQGRMLQANKLVKLKGIHKDELNVFKNLTSGRYILNVTVGETKESFKIEKENVK